MADWYQNEQRAMLELLMDRWVGTGEDQNEETFACVPMRIPDNVIVVSFVLREPVTHMTDEGSTLIPANSAITLVVQEYLIGAETATDEATAVWPLKKILEG